MSLLLALPFATALGRRVARLAFLALLLIPTRLLRTVLLLVTMITAMLAT